MNAVIPIDDLQSKIYLLRGQRVILSSDLAPLFRVPAFRLNEAVKRNRRRFPDDFCFQLTLEEVQRLTSQTAMIKKSGRGHHWKYLPYAFGEHGTIMLAHTLRSATAIAASVQVVRAFVKLRDFLAAHKELAAKLEELERRVATHDNHIQNIFQAIKQLMNPALPPPESKRRIGYRPEAAAKALGQAR